MTLTTNLLACYENSAASSASIADAAGLASSITLTGTPGTGTGIPNGGTIFNNGSGGSTGTQYGALPTPASGWNGISAASMSIWFNSTNISSTSNTFTLFAVPAAVHFNLFIGGVSAGYATLSGSINTGSANISTAIATSTNYHCVFIYNGTAGSAYLNNSLSSYTQSYTGTVDLRTALIANWPTLSRYFAGTIGQVALWSRALTGTEVGQLYNSGSGLAYSSWGGGGGTGDGTRRFPMMGVGWTPLFGVGALLIRNPKVTRRGFWMPR